MLEVEVEVEQEQEQAFFTIALEARAALVCRVAPK